MKRRRLRGSINGFRAPASGERDLADVEGDGDLSEFGNELLANRGEEIWESAVSMDGSSGSSSMGVIGGGGVSGTSSGIKSLDRRDR